DGARKCIAEPAAAWNSSVLCTSTSNEPVLLLPAASRSVPVCTSTSPVLLKRALIIVVLVSTSLINLPALLKMAVASEATEEPVPCTVKTEPGRLFRTAPLLMPRGPKLDQSAPPARSNVRPTNESTPPKGLIVSKPLTTVRPGPLIVPPFQDIAPATVTVP